MLKQSYLLTILAAFLLVFTSCDKDKDKDPEPKTTLESQLAQKEWKVTAQVVKKGNQAAENVLDIIYEEFEVDEITFKIDGKGGYTISSHGQEVHDGSYEVNNDDKEIDWNYPATIAWLTSEDDILTYDVELNGDNLKLIVNSTYEGQAFQETITFKAN